MVKRDYSKLVEDKEQIKQKQGNIYGQDLVKALSKKGWTLTHYREIFFDKDEMIGFLNT